MGTVGGGDSGVRSGGKGSAWGKRQEKKLVWPINTERTAAEYGVVVISGHCRWNDSWFGTAGTPAQSQRLEWSPINHKEKPKAGYGNKKQVSMNAFNIQSLAGARRGGMLSDIVSWAPPSVLKGGHWTETCRGILLPFSLLGRAELLFLLCSGCQRAQRGGKHGAWEERGKEGASGPC